MSGGRFRLLLALLIVVVAVGSFFVTSALLGDDPTTPAGATTTEGTPASPPSSSTTTTVAGGGIGPTPAYVVVVTSALDEGSAQASRDMLTDQGYDAGVLDSDDYASLNPGYYVAYVGPYATSAEATAGRDQLVNQDGYSLAEIYVRCVGTKEECA